MKVDLLLITILSLFLLVYCRLRKDTVNDNDNIGHINEITKCNDEPFPSLPLRTLKSLGICGTHDYMNSPHDIINCTKIDSRRDYSFSNFILDTDHRKYRFDLLKAITNNGKFIPYNGKMVLITVVNTGFLFLFYNWLCSVENNIGSIETTISSLIVLASDDDASKILKKQGFNVISLRDMVPNEKNYEISKLPPTFFGENNIALQKGCLFTLASDIVTLGYEFLLFDVDVTWKRDPKPFLARFGHNIDFLFTHDGRYPYEGNFYDIDGPINSGIIYGRPNCRTRIVLDTLSANIDLAFKHLRSTDQGIFNMIVYQSPRFRTLRIGILPWNLFVNGHIFHRKDKFSSIDWSRVIMIHASWTTNWKLKVKKFMKTNDYYFKQDGNCTYYNKEYDILLHSNNTLDDEDIVST